MLYQELKLHVSGTSLARAYAITLRERLIKLGGWIDDPRSTPILAQFRAKGSARQRRAGAIHALARAL